MWRTPALPTLEDGPSTVFCVAVTACTVVMRPSLKPKLSTMTAQGGWRAVRVTQAFDGAAACRAPLTMGARQLVVQLALETIKSDALYESWLTPTTIMGVSSLEGCREGGGQRHTSKGRPSCRGYTPRA